MKRIIIGFMVVFAFIPNVKAYTKAQCKSYAYKQVIKKGWTKTDYDNLVKLWNKESNWNAKAVKMSEALFSGKVKDLTVKDIDLLFKDAEKKVLDNEMNIVDLLVELGICSSKREAREFVSGGTISINGDRVTDLEKIISKPRCKFFNIFICIF